VLRTREGYYSIFFRYPDFGRNLAFPQKKKNRTQNRTKNRKFREKKKGILHVGHHCITLHIFFVIFHHLWPAPQFSFLSKKKKKKPYMIPGETLCSLKNPNIDGLHNLSVSRKNKKKHKGVTHQKK